jgi:hypothetical protein
MNRPTKAKRRDQGVALVTTVIVVAVLAVVAAAMMQSTTVDRLSSRSALNYAQAKLAAETAATVAESMITGLVTRYPDSITVWQNIGGGTANGTNNEATVLYARAQAANTNAAARPGQFGPDLVLLGQPLVSRTSSVPEMANTNMLPLSSIPSSVPFSPGSQIAVNLNQTNSAMIQPFVGARTATNAGAPITAAQWIYVSRYGGPTNATNPYVARYAFWVEDESFKVNVNVATNGERGAASLGLTTSEARVNGPLQSSTNRLLRNVDAAAIISNRNSLPGRSFPTPLTALVPRGVTNAEAGSEFRFLFTGNSAGLNLSRAGFKRVNINTLNSGIGLSADPNQVSQVRTNLDRIIATVTNANAAPNFGQRFYRSSANALGINETSAVTAANARIYLNKIAANMLDYLDTDNQPTIINNDPNFTIRSGKPEYAIEPVGGGNQGVNPVAAIGQESVPRLQEYALHARLLKMDPVGFNTNDPSRPADAELEFTLDHYFEFWNPSQRDVTAADLGNPTLKVHGQPALGGPGLKPPLPEGRDFEVQIPPGTVFPAGGVVVLTTAPTNELNNKLLAGAPNVVSLPVPPAVRRYTGRTPDSTNNPSNFRNLHRLFNVTLRPRSTTATDYETGVLLANSVGHLESFVGLPIASSGGNPALSLRVTNNSMLGRSDDFFISGGSLRGNGTTVGPSSTEGDPRALNEQMQFQIYASDSSTDQTRFFWTQLANGRVPADSTLGRPNANFVRPTNWVDFSSISAGSGEAPLVIRNGPMQTIGELGHLTDPARVPGTSGSLTNVAYSRGGGRTLRVGQPEHARWYDGNQTNASRTWASWRLADIFSVNSSLVITGALNPNGVLRDGGAALRAALFGLQFRPTPDGAPLTANQQLVVSNLVSNAITRMLNSTSAGLPANTVNAFWERGEVSELSAFNSGTNLAGVSMNAAFDRGREEVLRRSVEMLTMRGSVFTAYTIGQTLQVTPGGTNVGSTCRLKRTFEIIPQFADVASATNDLFAPEDISRRFVAPTNYQVRLIRSEYE